MKSIWVFLLIVYSINSYGETLAPYGKVEFGIGRIYVSRDYGIDNDSDSSASTDFNIGLGSRIGSNIIVEYIYARSDGHSFLGMGDSYDLKQRQILIGYQFSMSGSLSVTPKLGVSNWRLTGREGVFLNPGKEGSSSLEGRDVIVSVELGWSIFDNLSIGLNNSWSNTEFGSALSTAFLAKYHL